MDYADLQQRLNVAVERYDSQTFLGSYRETARSSLLNAGLSTRANSLWKMAQYVVAKKDAGSPDGASSGYLIGWRTLASNYNNQTLLLEVGDGVWEAYDAQGNKLGDEQYIKDLLEKTSLQKQVTQPVKMVLMSYQLITYGAPGTGKSFGLSGCMKDKNGNDVAVSIRTTFHPDSDYSTFVGAYKPAMKKVQRIVQIGQDIKTPNYAAGFDESLKVEEKISYEFRPQAFINAYVAAWMDVTKPVVLVIEEINRGNCAQIFGDIFQLLDRDDATGWSSYPIDADTDLASWLKAVREKKADGADGDLIFGAKLDAIAKPAKIKDSDWADIKIGKKLALPPNLYIWAMMNTSDQSLFPIDSAFKRRWDWKYVPISKPDKSDDSNWKERKIKVGSSLYDWWDFITIINKHIAKATESEDKQLGYFFVKAPDDTGYITADQFANKVLFYLYGDVFKSYDLPAAAFKRDGGTAWIFRDFFYSKTVVIQKADGQIVKDAEGNVAKTVTDKTTQMLKKPGDVNEFELAAFLDHLKWKDEVVGKTSVGAGADA